MTVQTTWMMHTAGKARAWSQIALLTVTALLVACGSDSDSGEPSDDAGLSEQEQFLETNAARPSVTVTDSGLQYEVLRAANGARPNRESTITVHYVGELVDGTEFDNSYERGEPATFLLSGAIEGWVEGVQLMSVGSRYRFVMPADLAYGDRGAGDLIEPGVSLIFDIELLEINSN